LVESYLYNTIGVILIEKENMMDYDGFLELTKTRRSIRQFQTNSIPDGYVEKIIEAARWAPSGFHTQPWEFVIIKKKELRDKISDVIAPPIPLTQVSGESGTQKSSKRDHFRNAPVFIILLGDWRAKVGLPGNAQGQEKSVDNIFCSSLASAFLYMHLAAAALGLASCWVSAASRPEPQRKIKELLGIPEVLRFYDMMAVGYGAQLPIPKILRKWEDIVHYDACGEKDFRTDEEVAADAQETKAWCISTSR